MFRGYYYCKSTNGEKKGKAMQVTQDDLDDSDNERSNDDSNNFVAFTTSIGFANCFCTSVLKITNIDDESYESNDNENLQKAYNKLFEVSFTLNKHNVKLTKKIKKPMKD